MAVSSSRTGGGVEEPGLAAGAHRVCVAVQHGGMRRLIVELLEGQCGCEVVLDTHFCEAATLWNPPEADAIVVDESVFTAAGPARWSVPQGTPVVVIGREPDAGYRKAALESGAQGWLSRDRVGEDLGAEIARVLQGVQSADPHSNFP